MDLVFLFSLTFDANWVMCASRQGTASKHLACTVETYRVPQYGLLLAYLLWLPFNCPLLEFTFAGSYMYVCIYVSGALWAM